jgi:hypothetical protein
MKENKFHLECPHCGTKIVIDSATGEILSHEVPKQKDKLSLDERLKELGKEKERSEEIFSQQMGALHDKGRILEEKFKSALKKTKGTKAEKPLKDIDLD